MSESNKPVYRLRYGNVVAAVWNNSQAGHFYKTAFHKSYPIDSGGWGDSSSFDDRDLLNLAKAATDIHTWIHQQKAQAATVREEDVS